MYCSDALGCFAIWLPAGFSVCDSRICALHPRKKYVYLAGICIIGTEVTVSWRAGKCLLFFSSRKCVKSVFYSRQEVNRKWSDDGSDSGVLN